MTKTTRLLLPFTYGREMDTNEAAVLLAASHHAALVPLLDSYASGERKGVLLEHIQPSTGCLEAVQRKVFRHHIPLERFEVFTADRVQRLFVLVDQLGCDGIVLVLRGRNGSVLDAEMIEQRMAMRFCLLYLISLPAREFAWISRLRERISHWQPGHRRRADQHMPRLPALRERVGQEVVALIGHAEVPDLERASMGRKRHRD